MLHLSSFRLSGDENIALFRTVPWSALSPRLGQNTPTTELFSQKNQVLLSNFFSSSNMLFIRLFLANTWKKNRWLPGLFPRKLPWNVVMDSEITLRMENWRGGDWDETQNGAHVMRRKGCAMQNQGIALSENSDLSFLLFFFRNNAWWRTFKESWSVTFFSEESP